MQRLFLLCLCASIVLVIPAQAQESADKVSKEKAEKHKMSKMDHSKMEKKEHGMMEHGDVADQKAARAVIDALFDAMRAGDGEAVSAVFAENGRLMSTGNRDGEPFVRETPVAGFAGSVDKAVPGSLDERIWNVMIHVDNNLAMAWVPYAFYHDGNFSHCGVNAVQIARMTEGWKIVQLTDTRQREGCEVPDEVSGGK